jgi:CDP-paratose 2-epimerase
MRILITGVCGFVGSTLARAFREHRSSWEIVGIDTLVRAGSEMNRSALRVLGVKVLHGDIRIPSDLESLPSCDWIIDAAANPSVLAGVDGKTSSRQLIEHNLVGTINLLELARLPVQAQGDRFGIPDAASLPRGCSPAGVSEDFSTEPPLSLYGTTKRASELLALEYASTFDLPVYLNRCGVLAGAGQFGKIDQGIFSFWIHSWCRRRPLKYIGFDGTGHQVRDCLHARDLAPLLLRQIEAGAADAPRMVNVSGGVANSASLRQLSDWCGQRFGPHSVAVEKAARPFDIPWLILDSGRARQAWEWEPQTRLEAVWEEIATHAEQHPHWLDQVGEG